MISDIIKNNLIVDLTDGSPSDLSTRYPSLYPTSSDVPDFMYKSLKTLLVGSAASSQFVQEVVEDLGTGKANSKGGVIIIVDRIVPAYLDFAEPRMKNSDNGAESCFVKIVIGQPRVAVEDSNAVQNICQRIKYLLDSYERDARRESWTVPVGDKSISQDYFKMYWLDTQGIDPNNGIRSSGAMMYFKCMYRRAVPSMEDILG